MSLLDEARAATPRKGPSCGVGKFLANLSEDMQTEVTDVLADDECTVSGLVAALKGRGYAPPEIPSWQRHRRQECRCV